MALTREQVHHVATLARLELTPEEEERYAHQLSAVLEAVQALEEVDVEGVEPTSHATMASSLLREDEALPSLPTALGLANAPAVSGQSFSVPKVID